MMNRESFRGFLINKMVEKAERRGHKDHELSKSAEHLLLFSVGMVRTPNQRPEMVEKYEGILLGLSANPLVEAKIKHLMELPVNVFADKWNEQYGDKSRLKAKRDHPAKG